MRFFLKLSYRGTRFNGWQKQPDVPTVQETLEECLTAILKAPVEVAGCGRTDTGVHAKGYVAHFDFSKKLPVDFLKRINKSLSEQISVSAVSEVSVEAHARYDAIHRAYEYHIVFHKTPFEIDTAYHYPFAKDLDFEKLQAAAKMLLDYHVFYPFCKTNTQVKTMECQLFRSEWVIDEVSGRMIFNIAANRFLRGMVRLIVGMCLNVSAGKITLAEVRKAMEDQSRLPKSWSVPPEGLYLVDIRYPYVF